MSGPTVLITGCGAPGTYGTIWSINESPIGSEAEIVGVDMREEQAGKYACDHFETISAASEETFIPELLSISDKYDVEVILPQVTAELTKLADAKPEFDAIGTKIAVSDPAAIQTANNKFELIKICDELGIPAPKTRLVKEWDNLVEAGESLGFPKRPFVVKPPVSNGQRGFRIITPDEMSTSQFYDEKPRGTHLSIEQLRSILGSQFPELLVMEYLPGDEYSIDAFRSDDEFCAVPRSRDEVRSGISFQTTVNHNRDLIQAVRELSSAIGLEYSFGFQFKRDIDGELKILECNPRIQGTMVASALAGANVIAASTHALTNRPVPDLTPNWGTTFYRYWGGIGSVDSELIGNIGEIPGI